jgi:hypothetical protein
LAWSASGSKYHSKVYCRRHRVHNGSLGKSRSAAVNQARAEAVSDGHRRNRRWASENPGQRDEAWFKREITPKLDAFSLKEIVKSTGLSLAACSRIRAGARVPHPRHWTSLGKLVASLKG